MGLEPMISRTTIWRANQLHHTHHITYRTVFCPTKYHHIKFSGLNEPGGIRTLDLRLRRPLLYPAELQTHFSLNENLSFSNEKRVMGIEPTYPAWKAGVLPLNYTRVSCVISDTSYILSYVSEICKHKFNFFLQINIPSISTVIFTK